MIKRFLLIEDGSVDVDTLSTELADDTKIIVYRQGACQPILVELKEPAHYTYEEQLTIKEDDQ